MLRSLCTAPLWAWSVPLLCLLLPRALEAQIPRACTTPEALDSRTCCPLSKGSPCGSSEERGVCNSPNIPIIQTPIDYREDWPHAFFDRVCHCYGNYDGFDCSQCIFGYTGPLCRERHVVSRKEITDLTDEEREMFLSSMHKAKKDQSERFVILTSNDTTIKGNYAFRNASAYDLFAWSHYYATQTYAGTKTNSAHEGPAFGFWHRSFLLFMEREIRELTGNQAFSFPYWDWTRSDHCNVCTNEYMGGVGPNGSIDRGSRFSQWKTVCPFQDNLEVICNGNGSPVHLIRNPGKDPISSSLPTYQDSLDALKFKDYETPPFNPKSRHSFRNRLEGFDLGPKDPRHLAHAMHNLVHTYLNGTMTPVPSSANDPIFMVHHAFVDKLLEEWLIHNQNATYPDDPRVAQPQGAESYMAPFFPLRKNNFYLHKSINTLGYNYVDHSQMSPRHVPEARKANPNPTPRTQGPPHPGSSPPHPTLGPPHPTPPWVHPTPPWVHPTLGPPHPTLGPPHPTPPWVSEARNTGSSPKRHSSELE